MPTSSSSLVYATFLGVIGSLMLVESVSAIRRTRAGLPGRARKPGEHTWIHGLPLQDALPALAPLYQRHSTL